MRGKLINLVLVIVLIGGIGLILYPTISDRWNKAHQSIAVARYEDQVREMDTGEAERMLEAAREFNARLYEAGSAQQFLEEHMEEYQSLLNTDGSGIMGYVDVPQIHTTLPIYHGTDEAVLQVAAGHVEWTSLPVGGAGTHSVISGHRGLPSAKLFTDLDMMEPGDLFTLNIVGETFYYEVDDISVIRPEETNRLLPTAGQDYCTLVTCTPYGVNTHRLLVRGHRIDYDNTYRGEVVSEATVVQSWMLSASVTGGITLLMLMIYFLQKMRKQKDTDGGSSE